MRIFFTLLCILLSTLSTAQSELLAKNYFDRGEYAKAVSIYEKLYEEAPYKAEYIGSLVAAYQQLEAYDKAQKIIEQKLVGTRIQPQYYVDLGYNYALQQKDSLATITYKQALDEIDVAPNYATIIAKKFEEYSLLDQAIMAYEKGMLLNPNLNVNMQLARIYGEQGKLEQMFTKYIDLIITRPTYTSIAQRNFSLYITEDSQNEANIVLRKTLLKKSQEDPQIVFNQLLSWLFIQQKEYAKAFAQEKAIYKRTQEDLRGIIDLALISVSDKEYEIGNQIIDYVIENAATPESKLQAYQYKMKIAIATATKDDYPAIEQQFKQLLEEYGTNVNTYLLQIDYNHFLAFDANKSTLAIENLKNLADQNLTPYQEAQVKMELADILVFEENFNRALIYYSQIQKKVQSDVLAQEARFKVARTSYFKGDFEWAKAQVDVLRKSTSQLIANDALQLSLMISDNTTEDSLQTALKKFAKADLLALQNKNKASIALLTEILENHKGEKIEDEALLKRGTLYEAEGDYKNAEKDYVQLIELYKEDILADDAYFKLANLYENKLADPVKAKAYFEQIIFNYADSIYFIEARKRFRMLRGDEIE